jgi:hypothetical protein
MSSNDDANKVIKMITKLSPIWLLLSVSLLLCSCGSARIENLKSLKNAKQAAEYLMGTELTENQYRAAAAIGVAVNPPIDFLSRSFFGGKSDAAATVDMGDWQQDPVAAEKGVIYQAAKADAANQSWFAMFDTWSTLFWAGVTALFGASVAAGIKKIINLKGALVDSIRFGNEAIKVDPNNPEAVEQLKQNAIARKSGTGHAAELDAAMIKVRAG